ncbi:MAG TPA: catalase [Acidimicrobiales bacterium]|nr:catalase [Acidimicrobiales bacterium]
MKVGEIDELIDAIAAAGPGHVAGTRPVHAPGIGVTGSFQATDVAARYTDAPHFSGGRVPVSVRFSNGVVSKDVPDSAKVVRGMAVKFHLGDGRGTDMVCMTLPVFFARTVEQFRAFVAALSTPAGPPAPWWRKVAGLLRLSPVLAPDAVAAVAFADRNPEARQAVVGLDALPVPESYVTCTYHAVHAFRLTAGDRVTYGRFRWEPSAGVWPRANDAKRGDYLQDELRRRLATGPAELVLRMQVAEEGDDTSDPTTPWSERRRRVVMGHLQVDAVAPDQVAGAEALQFNPARLVPGIAVGDDPILAARDEVYRRSAGRRRARSN